MDEREPCGPWGQKKKEIKKWAPSDPDKDWPLSSSEADANGLSIEKEMVSQLLVDHQVIFP